MESIMDATKTIPLLIPTFILFLMTIITNVYGQSTGHPFEGVWSDTVEVMGQTFHPIFHIKPDADHPQSLIVTITYPSIGMYEMTPENYRFEHDSLIVELENTSYMMRPTADGTRIEGTLSFYGQTYPISMHPTQPSALVPPRYRDRPEADPADVVSPESIVKATYDAVSFPDGNEPDWDRLLSLFLPESRLTPTGRINGTPHIDFRSVEDHFKEGMLERFSNQRFVEYEIHSVTERFGDMVHVFSTYESVIKTEGPEPVNRGINSFQLWYDGNRWWIAGLMWQSERDGLPVPDRYLSQ